MFGTYIHMMMQHKFTATGVQLFTTKNDKAILSTTTTAMLSCLFFYFLHGRLKRTEIPSERGSGTKAIDELF